MVGAALTCSFIFCLSVICDRAMNGSNERISTDLEPAPLICVDRVRVSSSDLPSDLEPTTI